MFVDILETVYSPRWTEVIPYNLNAEIDFRFGVVVQN